MLLTRQEDPAKGECFKEGMDMTVSQIHGPNDSHTQKRDCCEIGILTDAVSVLNCYLEPAFYSLPRDNVKRPCEPLVHINLGCL